MCASLSVKHTIRNDVKLLIGPKRLLPKAADW